MPQYPLPYTTQVYVGGQWVQSFQFYESDGQTLLNISAYTFEVVVRTSTDDTGTPAILVSSAAPTTAGSITINSGTSTITVTFNPAATSTLVASENYAITGWANQDTSSASVFMSGNVYAAPVAAAV